MPRRSPNFELHNLVNFSWRQRLDAARQLTKASKKAPQLEIELPYPADGYKRTIRAYRRLGSVANRAAAAQLSAYAIRDNVNEEIIGMATTQVLRPKPPDEMIEKSGGIEVSYWHRQYHDELAERIGLTIVQALLDAKCATPGATGKEVGWMVTLPDDRVKSTVALDANLEPHKIQPYDINDGVSRERQLWVEKALTSLP